MKIVFVSNFMNHHQLPFSQKLHDMPDVDYWFIATEDIPLERKNMGYHDMNNQYSFVLCTYEEDSQIEKALQLCLEADVVIFGSAPVMYIKERLRQKKLTFKYSERIYKKEPKLWTMPLRYIKYNINNRRHNNLYMLCASAYTAYDYSRTKTFIGKTFKWGYFPEFYVYKDIERIINNKKPNSILWVGRLIDWKHPEIAIEIGKKLKKDEIEFEMNIIGTGMMEKDLKKEVISNDLENYIHFIGAMSPEEVRNYMLNSQIYLFTSDRQEGWGAVLNEAMNSGCSIIAGNAIGSVPYLIKDKINGFIYDNDNIDLIYRNVKALINNPTKQKQMGMMAYQTIEKIWNADIASKRIVELSKKLLECGKYVELYQSGPCSRAESLRG